MQYSRSAFCISPRDRRGHGRLLLPIARGSVRVVSEHSSLSEESIDRQREANRRIHSRALTTPREACCGSLVSLGLHWIAYRCSGTEGVSFAPSSVGVQHLLPRDEAPWRGSRRGVPSPGSDTVHERSHLPSGRCQTMAYFCRSSRLPPFLVAAEVQDDARM